MKEHYWRDHEKNQFHPYQCKHCDKKFDIWEDMLLHESEVHEIKRKILQCEKCPCVYLSPQLYSMHNYFHLPNGDPPIFCELSFGRNNQCEFTSTKRIDFIQHHEKQHKDKPAPFYKCETCDFIDEKLNMLNIHF